MKLLLKIRLKRVSIISTCLIIGMIILSSWTPVPEEKRIRFEFSKDDCGLDNGVYRIIISMLESQYVMEYNSFNGRVESKFSHYAWHDYFAGERTHCSGSCYMWCPYKFKIKVSSRSSLKKFNPATTFTINIYINDGEIRSIKGLKLNEEKTMFLWNDGPEDKLKQQDEEYIIFETPTEIPRGSEIPQAKSKKTKYTGDE